ncbi:hypothetical protein BB560_000531 [Smittium megazygosporum]|uniref:Mitochondrial inner membrane protease subunit 2 n=1 Tax=Smittium megazygosporum TaxID=133381 RepID=A0A2T9ZK57_9FUNG|nr:hypothetical protein BB560_000531 [Smittium megazygosporum]
MSKLGSRVFKALLWIPVVIYINDNIFSMTFIQGRSMQPALNPDTNKLKSDLVLLDKTVTGSGSKFFLKIGDVVTLYDPFRPDTILVKRIIGLPGSLITPTNNSQFPSKSPIVIPAGHCWIEGDEGFHSVDSNSFGYVPLGLIHGRVSFVLYPFSRFGFVDPKENRDLVFIF